jgi:hypothetical protein
MSKRFNVVNEFLTLPAWPANKRRGGDVYQIRLALGWMANRGDRR